MLEKAWDIFLMVLPAVVGYFVNTFRRNTRRVSIKKLLRFNFKKTEQPSIQFITANTGCYDENELVTLGFIFEYMSVGEIKASLSKLYGPELDMKTTMCKEQFVDMKRKYLKQNLILVGGPIHNSVTRALFDRMENCPFRFDLNDASLIYTDENFSETRFTSRMYSPTVECGKKPYYENDYALVMNVRNPLDPNKRIILVSGCRSVGCYGAAVFLSQKLREIKKLAKKDEYAFVIKCDGEREDLVSPPELCAVYPLNIRYRL